MKAAARAANAADFVERLPEGYYTQARFDVRICSGARVRCLHGCKTRVWHILGTGVTRQCMVFLAVAGWQRMEPRFLATV